MLHLIAKHELLGVRIQIHLLLHPLRHRVAVKASLEYWTSGQCPDCPGGRCAFR